MNERVVFSIDFWESSHSWGSSESLRWALLVHEIS